jgi:hypothetical protein
MIRFGELGFKKNEDYEFLAEGCRVTIDHDPTAINGGVMQIDLPGGAVLIVSLDFRPGRGTYSLTAAEHAKAQADPAMANQLPTEPW